MAESQIDGVALIVKFGLSFPNALDEFRDAIHFLFAAGNHALGECAKIDHSRFGFPIHKIDDFGEDWLCGIEQLRMRLSTTIVPIAKRFPVTAIAGGPEDVALA